ncbi:hypothetical protein Goklo_005823, partial [Gossypium klotzschianum]|nr:hypothetical protein [Gossypium klotzschianum]
RDVRGRVNKSRPCRRDLCPRKQITLTWTRFADTSPDIVLMQSGLGTCPVPWLRHHQSTRHGRQSGTPSNPSSSLPSSLRIP